MRKTIMRVVGLSLIIVSALTYLGWTLSFQSAVLFYLLYPGGRYGAAYCRRTWWYDNSGLG